MAPAPFFPWSLDFIKTSLTSTFFISFSSPQFKKFVTKKLNWFHYFNRKKISEKHFKVETWSCARTQQLLFAQICKWEHRKNSGICFEYLTWKLKACVRDHWEWICACDCFVCGKTCSVYSSEKNKNIFCEWTEKREPKHHHQH